MAIVIGKFKEVLKASTIPCLVPKYAFIGRRGKAWVMAPYKEFSADEIGCSVDELHRYWDEEIESDKKMKSIGKEDIEDFCEWMTDIP